MCFIHVAITCLENPLSTCDVVHVKAVEDVSSNISKVKGERCFPSDDINSNRHKTMNGTKQPCEGEGINIIPK